MTAAHWAGVVVLSPVAGLAYLTFYKALGLGPIAIVSPIASANGVLVVGLAVLVLGDPLSAEQAAGAAVVLVGAGLAAAEGGERGRGATGPGGPRLAAFASRPSAATCSASSCWSRSWAGCSRCCSRAPAA